MRSIRSVVYRMLDYTLREPRYRGRDEALTWLDVRYAEILRVGRCSWLQQ